MELGPEDVSLLERCPHFRGCYVQASMELGPEDVSLLERCPSRCVHLSTLQVMYNVYTCTLHLIPGTSWCWHSLH